MNILVHHQKLPSKKGGYKNNNSVKTKAQRRRHAKPAAQAKWTGKGQNVAQTSKSSEVEKQNDLSRHGLSPSQERKYKQTLEPEREIVAKSLPCKKENAQNSKTSLNNELDYEQMERSNSNAHNKLTTPSVPNTLSVSKKINVPN
jgi:hypothetical protein